MAQAKRICTTIIKAWVRQNFFLLPIVYSRREKNETELLFVSPLT